MLRRRLQMSEPGEGQPSWLGRGWLPARALLALSAASAALAVGCDSRAPAPPDPTPAREARAASASTRAADTPPQLPRSEDPRVAALVEALERSDLAEARRFATGVAGLDELDARLAVARLRFAEGDQIGAVRTLEEARLAFPRQARVYATAAELDAWAGRMRSAEDEVREGLAVCGPSPDLLRARAVLALCRTGGAALALEHLLAARDQDPGLPYLSRPLAQAHVLLASQRMAASPPDLLSAMGHASAALKVLPGDPEALRLLADSKSALGELEEAVALYEQLIEAGDGAAAHACAQLLPRAATLALASRDRERALGHYLRARELGLPDEDMGFGVHVLSDESERALDAGIERARQGDLPGARERFERALTLTPDSLEARSLIGAILLQQGETPAAIEAWSAVLASARARGVELPTPVHLDLARALRVAGRLEEARALLREELARAPEGPWAEETRALLALLGESEAGH